MFEYPGECYEVIRKAFRNVDREVEFISGLVPPGSAILDVGCGTGTVLRKLHPMGYWCVGVDQSAHWIQYAREQAGNADGLEFHHRMVEQFEPAETFDLVMAIFVTINYWEYRNIRPNFRRMRSWLKPGGRLLLDFAHLLNFVDRYQPYIIAQHHSDGFDITRLITHTIEPHKGNWAHDETLLVGRNGRIEMYRDHLDQQVIKVEEVIQLLEDAGFDDFEKYQGFDKKAKLTGRGELIIVAS